MFLDYQTSQIVLLMLKSLNMMSRIDVLFLKTRLSGNVKMRKIFEFYCTECHKYFDVKLNVSINGDRRIHCPNCDHIHYRVITDGCITDTRMSEKSDSMLVEDIRPMKASCRDYQKEKAEDMAEDLSGFMHRLWKDIAYKT